METTEAIKTIQGTVVRRSGKKSVVVEVSRHVKHPVFFKYMRRRSRFHVHDPAETCGIGDLVIIRACRPISKLKRWVLKSVVTKGDAAVKAEELGL